MENCREQFHERSCQQVEIEIEIISKNACSATEFHNLQFKLLQIKVSF